MSKQVRQTERSETVKAVSVADYIVDRLAANQLTLFAAGTIVLLIFSWSYVNP
jgi:hypothetical protein